MNLQSMLKIYAFDPLFFRDGKPFTMGNEHGANGIFPPYPSVFYGALRTLYFSSRIELFQMLKKERKFNNPQDDPSRSLKIKGVFISVNDEPFFPLPLDCVEEEDSDNQEVMVLELKDNEFISSNRLPKILVPPTGETVENVENGYFSIYEMEEYLNGKKKDKLPYVNLMDYTYKEEKIGIARNYKTRHTQEQMLYKISMTRMVPNLSILVDYEGLELPEKGVLRLGGEGKIASYETVKIPKIEAPKITSSCFKVYLATPALFRNGWLPGWINGDESGEDRYQGNFNGVRIRLLAAAIGRYVSIGGFDMARNYPKVMRRAVPAGSVYYFSADCDENTIIDLFHGRNISDYRNEEGFGLAFVGRV